MDPLSLSAALSGFLSLATQVTQILKEYTETVKSAPTDARNMLVEVDALAQALGQLKNFLQDNDDAVSAKINFHDQSALVAAMKICGEAIYSLHQRVGRLASSGKGKNRQWRKQLKWPFQKEDCAQIIERLHRCSQTFEFSLTISNWYVSHPLLSPTLIIIDEATCSELLANTSKELRECKNGMEAILKFAPELSSRIDYLSNIVDLIPICTERVEAKIDKLARKTESKSPR